MAEQIFTAYGFDFVADTMDWQDSADAEKASEKLGEIVASFSADEAAELHGLLAKAAEGEIEWTHPTLKALERRCSAVLADVTHDYLGNVDTGHNCTILAG
jgi:hypothetical protein